MGQRSRSQGHSFAAILSITAAAPTRSSGETISCRNTTPITFARRCRSEASSSAGDRQRGRACPRRTDVRSLRPTRQAAGRQT